MAEKTYGASAMIALVPTEEDAARLAVDGYQPAEDLHVTLVFLGDADDLDEDSLRAIEAGVQRLAASTGPLALTTWSTSHFNPTGDSPCSVYLIGGGDDDSTLDDLGDLSMKLASREFSGLPEQHVPWVPHMTIGYDLEPTALSEAGKPLLFDRIRLAVGDEDRDYMLDGPSGAMAASLAAEVGFRLARVETLLAARGGALSKLKRVFNELLHPRGSDGRFIEKNGWVSGSVDVDGKDTPISRGKVSGFIDNPADSSDPVVEVVVGDRTFRGLASKMKKTASPKARLDGPDGNALTEGDVPDAPDVDVPDSPDMDLNAPQPLTDWELSDVLDNPSLPDSDAIEPAVVADVLNQPGEPTEVFSAIEALEALGRGEKVHLNSRDEVSIILDAMVKMANDAKEQGDDTPRLNLCDVHIEDVSVFCNNSMGIPRLQMPQLGGTPTPGSRADGLEKSPFGTVNLANEFMAHLQEQGHTITPGTTKASHLKASQNELDGPKVASIATRIADNPITADVPLFTSSDDYVVDGHHRWAATFVNGEDTEIPTAQVDMDILSLLAEADHFAQEWGIAPKGLSGQDDRSRRPLPAEAQELWSSLAVDVQGLSTTNADERAAQLDGALGKVFQSDLDTDVLYDKLGPAEDRWEPERAYLHERMWRDLINQIQEAEIPKDRDALVLGGLPGAGKSSALKPGEAAEAFGIVSWDPAEGLPEGATHVSINPDSIKEMMISYDAMPDLPPELKPMESVTLIHEESSFLSKLFLKRLSDEGYNVVLDNTMETPRGMLKRMVPLASEGYSFNALFVDIPVEESKLSARRRYARSFDTELGGRLVPSSVQHGRVSTRGRMSPNRDAFDELAGIDENNNVSGTGWFKNFLVVDNTGVSEGKPLKTVTVQGGGDGSPAAAIREASAAVAPEAPDPEAPDSPVGVPAAV